MGHHTIQFPTQSLDDPQDSGSDDEVNDNWI